jgi:hypothetical protein
MYSSYPLRLAPGDTLTTLDSVSRATVHLTFSDRDDLIWRIAREKDLGNLVEIERLPRAA